MNNFFTNCFFTLLFIGLLALFISICFLGYIVERPYSLTNSGNFSIERHTLTLEIKYYVSEKFDQNYGQRVDSIETEIETQFVRNMFQICLNELQNKKRLISGAIAFGDEELKQRARLLKLSSCPEFI